MQLSFEESENSSTFADASAYGHQAYCASSGVCPVSGLSGQQGQAVQFDGLNDYLIVDHSDALQPSKGIAISAWVKPFVSSTLPSPYMTVVNKFLKYELNIVNQYGGLSAGITNEAGQRVVLHTGKVLNLNEWSFITMTYDGQNIKVYVNGIFKASKPQTGTISHAPRWLKIGSYNNNYYFNGLLDELKIYNRAMSAEEVLAAYEVAK